MSFYVLSWLINFAILLHSLQRENSEDNEDEKKEGDNDENASVIDDEVCSCSWILCCDIVYNSSYP